MKICFIGKYPPIEGGVSAQSFWIVRRLAQCGHHVSVVTNAPEVESRFRIHLDPYDHEMLNYKNSNGKGSVTVYQTTQFSPPIMGHIPRSNPFVSKLAGLATEVIEKDDCEALFAYYYEPYAVAGALAAQWSGRPIAIKHAGSDLDRLFLNPDLAATYSRALTNADIVITQPRLARRFLALGVKPENLCRDAAFALPKEFFHPEEKQSNEYFTIGMYGKPGAFKGTFDLITALGKLRLSGRSFRLKLLIGEEQENIISEDLIRAGIKDWTEILDFVPNWKVPNFINSCDAVCFLERDFPVAIHGPIIPREVLSCGTCLVVSGEIANNQIARLPIKNGKNIVVVENPKATNELMNALGDLIDTPGRAQLIGAEGRKISIQIENEIDATEHWESLLKTLVSGITLPDKLSIVTNDDLESTLSLILPELIPGLVSNAPGILDNYPYDSSLNPMLLANEFCSFASRAISKYLPSDTLQIVNELIRACSTRTTLLNCHEFLEPNCSLLPIQDDVLLSSRLYIPRTTSMYEASHDISELLSTNTEGNLWLEMIRDAPAKQTYFLFACRPNKVVQEMKISEDFADLLKSIDGTKTVEELLLPFIGPGTDSNHETALRPLRHLIKIRALAVTVQ